MNEAALVVGLVRLLAALPVLRWPLAGALLAIAVDLADLALFSYLGFGWPGDYQRFDKVADGFYLITFLAVAMRWTGVERRVAVALFVVRAAGIAVFTVTAARGTLLVFPNLFEAWFVFVAARDKLAPRLVLNARRSGWALGALAAWKLPQEWLLHVDRRLDSYALTDVVDELVRRLSGSP